MISTKAFCHHISADRRDVRAPHTKVSFWHMSDNLTALKREMPLKTWPSSEINLLVKKTHNFNAVVMLQVVRGMV